MIIILGEFFIHFSELLINIFIRIIDFIISLLNKFENDSRSYDEKNLINSKNEIASENNGIFKINNFLKNDSIFEELENRYSKDSSSNGQNFHNQSFNIFTSLNNDKESKDSQSNENNSSQDELNSGESDNNLNLIERLEEKKFIFC